MFFFCWFMRNMDSLPIWNYKEQIMGDIKAKDISMLCASTGSGKSSQVPQWLIDCNAENKVLVTQPRSKFLSLFILLKQNKLWILERNIFEHNRIQRKSHYNYRDDFALGKFEKIKILVYHICAKNG